jgi:diadenosine tetraphosphate (Ap4A) HIT family hydrolase
MKKHVNPQNTRSRPDASYGKVIEQIAKDGVCPFCPENLAKYHKLPVTEKKHWLVTDNMYPYKPSNYHRLLIHKAHIEHISELSPEAWAELSEIIREESKRANIAGGTFVMRFGDTKYTGASVTHLHANLVQSNPDDLTYNKEKGLLTRIG